MFTVRRMAAADKPAMMEISSLIWEGSDYLPGVFDAWCEDREGEFAAVLFGGRLVGCGKLSFLTPVDAWLEGLRKDPRVTEKGLADQVARHFLTRLAERGGLASVRFSTYAKNAASIGANGRLGFVLRTSFSIKAWEGTREQLEARDPGTVAGPEERLETVRDARAVLDFFERRGYFLATQGLIVDGWKAWPYTPALLVEHFVTEGRCRGVIVNSELRAALIDSTTEEPRRSIARIVALDSLDDRGALLLLDDLRARRLAAAPAERPLGLEWMVPSVQRMKQWCASWGLSSWEQEDDFLVYELPLRLLAGFARRRGSAEE
jgi:hypothetical protein